MTLSAYDRAVAEHKREFANHDETTMDTNGKYDHDRYFIGQPSEGGAWEVGDRENGCDRIAECSSKAKAVRVWRALIASDAKDAATGTLAELENEDLRLALAHNEDACLELDGELNLLRYELAGLQRLIDDLFAARHNGGTVPVREEPAPRRRRKVRT